MFMDNDILCCYVYGQLVFDAVMFLHNDIQIKLNLVAQIGALKYYRTLVGYIGLGPFWKYGLRLFVGQPNKISNLLTYLLT